MKTLLAALLVAAAPLVHAVTGSGVIKTETRPVSGFTAIASAGSVKLVLRQGSREGLELRGDDNVLPLIETRLVSRDGVTTLEIGTKRGESYTTREPVVATVDLVTLRALALAGSGSVSCDALKTTTLLVASSGSNQLKLHQLAADELRLLLKRLFMLISPLSLTLLVPSVFCISLSLSLYFF